MLFTTVALIWHLSGIAHARGVDLESLLDSSPTDLRGSFEEVGPPSTDPLFGMQRFDSPSFEKAAAKAAAQHSPGVWMIQTGSGMGFVATGDGSYPKNLSNANAAREAHRQAYVAAHMRAKKNLAQALRGLPLEARERLAEEAYDEDNARESLNSRSSRYDEQIFQALEATLRGFVTLLGLRRRRGPRLREHRHIPEDPPRHRSGFRRTSGLYFPGSRNEANFPGTRRGAGTPP